MESSLFWEDAFLVFAQSVWASVEIISFSATRFEELSWRSNPSGDLAVTLLPRCVPVAMLVLWGRRFVAGLRAAMGSHGAFFLFASPGRFANSTFTALDAQTGR